MSKRWKIRPDGSNWGDFGPDDQLGRLNLLTEARVLEAVKQVRTGKTFCLSMPLDLPGGNAINPSRLPPELKPVIREGEIAFDGPARRDNPLQTDLLCDDAMLIHSQYSTQWDSFAHIGAMFDADGDGEAEHVYYNGYKVLSEETSKGLYGAIGAVNLGIENMAESCVQGRGVMIDLRAHCGDERRAVGFAELMAIMAKDNVEVAEGDLVCLHTGFADRIVEAAKTPDPQPVGAVCTVLDGDDKALLNWISESGVAALVSDNVAVEQSSSVAREMKVPGPVLPLHEHCLFKIGVPLGELWHLSELAGWLRENKRTRFLLTAPPLRMPGAVGSPATPVATV
ncbi:MAG: cyclase family protein [Rhodospirillaceae bacterium]|nr:cyclase family protein [Rhodospirillaceae bacterium]